MTYLERTEEREGKNDNIVANKQRRQQFPFATTMVTIESLSGVRVDPLDLSALCMIPDYAVSGGLSRGAIFRGASIVER